jgi:hypothetical protein
MRLARPVQVFLYFWMGGLGLFCVIEIAAWLASGKPMLKDLMPFGMLAFGYGITMAGFKPEAAKAGKFLAELFEAVPA